MTLPRTTPAEQGVDETAIEEFLDVVEHDRLGLHSLMVLRHGAVIAEGWWHPYTADRRHMAFSLSKSFTSTAIGIAQDEGLLSIEEPVLSFFPSHATDAVRANAAGLTLRHLLTMTSGHAADTWDIISRLPQDDWVRLFLESPMVYPPGEFFVYNTGATFVLGAALRARTGQSISEYLTPRLFEPLGMQTPPWQRNARGLEFAGSGMRLLTEDIASLGQLYVQGGRWGSAQIVSPEWVAAASSLQVRNDQPDRGGDWARGYGFQFWRSQHGFRGDGAFGQFCIVLPEQDAVVALTSGTDDLQGVLRAVWTRLLPGLGASEDDGRSSRGGDSAVRTGQAPDRLRERLNALVLPGPDAGVVPDPLPRYASATIEVPFMRLGVASIRLALAAEPDSWTMTLTGRDGSVETHSVAPDSWNSSVTRFWSSDELESAAVASRGTWTPEGFRILQQCIDTPFVREWRFAELRDGRVRVEVGLTFMPGAAVPERVEGSVSG